MAVQQLEDIVGIALFDRTTRTVLLTSEGADFMHTAERLVADFDVAMQDVHAAAARRRGLLGIASVQSLTIKVLPQAFRIFGKARPLVRVSIWEGNSAEVRLRVRRNEVDVGFGSKGGDNNDLEFIPLFRDLIGSCRMATIL
jgi:LysR family carnitine catabolism transcriptional activator